MARRTQQEIDQIMDVYEGMTVRGFSTAEQHYRAAEKLLKCVPDLCDAARENNEYMPVLRAERDEARDTIADLKAQLQRAREREREAVELLATATMALHPSEMRSPDMWKIRRDAWLAAVKKEKGEEFVKAD